MMRRMSTSTALWPRWQADTPFRLFSMTFARWVELMEGSEWSAGFLDTCFYIGIYTAMLKIC